MNLARIAYAYARKSPLTTLLNLALLMLGVATVTLLLLTPLVGACGNGGSNQSWVGSVTRLSPRVCVGRHAAMQTLAL